MPRYFFHIDHVNVGHDDIGVDLPDVGRAKEEAVRAAGDHLVESSLGLWDSPMWTLSVQDEAGKAVFSLKITASESII